MKFGDAKALLHARWFVLELPESAIADKSIWSEGAFLKVTEWRTVLPPGEGEYAQATRFTSESGAALIKLLSDSHTGHVHVSLYEVVTKHFDEPEFRLFPGELSLVGIYSAGALVGAAAQVKP